MYIYNITTSDWYNSLSYIIKEIYVYVNRNVDIIVKYTANAIEDLKCRTFIILNGLIIPTLNNLFNICVIND